METSTNKVINKKVAVLKEEFKTYLQEKYSHLKDKSVILSDAFYLHRHDIGISLWEALESKGSMKRCQDLFEDYFTSEHKVKNPISNTYTYMRSIKILKEFIDETYGGVTALIKNEMNKVRVSREKAVKTNKNRKNTSDVNSDVPQPSQDELEKYLYVWDTLENYSLQESALEKLFLRTYPNNTDIDDVLIKVSALNDFYSTNIFSPFQVAKHIISLDIDDRLKKGDITLVNEVAIVQLGNGSVKNFYSFASKYCSHHNSKEFPIYDSYVDKVLSYFRDIDSFCDYKNGELKKYTKFKNVLLQFRVFYKLESYTLKDIDKYLWLLGKEKFPNKYS